MIPLFKVFMSKDVGEAVQQTIYSGMITQGQKVEEFEEKLRELFGYPYILTLNSATAGLTMAMRMIKDEFESKGMIWSNEDEVLTTPLTCMATNVPISANHMRLRWVDVDKHTGLIDLDDLETKINKHTKIISFVHWGGYPVDMEKLDQILTRKEKELGFRPQVIEDCAHAFLSEYKGKKLGTMGNYAVFSLQAIKHLTTGDGGLIFCPSQEAYEKAKLLRWYGIDRAKRNYKGKDFRLEADVVDWGYKFHMNDINATIGLNNLPHIEGNIQSIRKNAEYFDAHITNPYVTIVQPFDDIYKSSYWLYTIFVDEKAKFIEHMKEQSVMVSQVHQRNDIHTCFKEFRCSLPNLDSVEQKIVCIPVGWWLTEKERDAIVSAVNSFSP
jgi:dTDP-4-amino-4,6-dideoxygalactose transaminase